MNRFVLLIVLSFLSLNAFSEYSESDHTSKVLYEDYLTYRQKIDSIVEKNYSYIIANYALPSKSINYVKNSYFEWKSKTN